jgi:hypothetical protein
MNDYNYKKKKKQMKYVRTVYESLLKKYTLLKPDEAEHYATLAWSR